MSCANRQTPTRRYARKVRQLTRENRVLREQLDKRNAVIKVLREESAGRDEEVSK